LTAGLGLGMMPCQGDQPLVGLTGRVNEAKRRGLWLPVRIKQTGWLVYEKVGERGVR
jgi:hypothetical protein